MIRVFLLKNRPIFGLNREICHIIVYTRYFTWSINHWSVFNPADFMQDWSIFDFDFFWDFSLTMSQLGNFWVVSISGIRILLLFFRIYFGPLICCWTFSLLREPKVYLTSPRFKIRAHQKNTLYFKNGFQIMKNYHSHLIRDLWLINSLGSK